MKRIDPRKRARTLFIETERFARLQGNGNVTLNYGACQRRFRPEDDDAGLLAKARLRSRMQRHDDCEVVCKPFNAQFNVVRGASTPSDTPVNAELFPYEKRIQKKLSSHEAAVAFHMLYNICNRHKTLRVTPAMRDGTTHVWSMEDGLNVVEA